MAFLIVIFVMFNCRCLGGWQIFFFVLWTSGDLWFMNLAASPTQKPNHKPNSIETSFVFAFYSLGFLLDLFFV